MKQFRKELENLINRHSMENQSDTPDFILARYLTNALENFDAAVKEREQWYGRKQKLIELGNVRDEDLEPLKDVPFPSVDDAPAEKLIINTEQSVGITPKGFEPNGKLNIK